MRPQVWSLAPCKLATVAHVYNPSTQGRGHPHLHIKIQANLISKEGRKGGVSAGGGAGGGDKEGKEADRRTGKKAH